MAENKVVMKPHAIMIAVPYQGHFNPFIHLAIKLASRGIAITFVHTESAHQQIALAHQRNCTTNNAQEFDIFSQARNAAGGLDIRYTTIPDGLPIDYDRDANVYQFWEHMLDEFPKLVDKFVANFIKESSSNDPSLVPFLVADTISSWPGSIAKKHMVYVSFWTELSVVFAINFHINLLRENGHFPPSGNNKQDCLIDYIPGVEPIHMKDMMSNIQAESPKVLWEVFFRSFEDVKKADFVLHNTVQELEPQTLSALNKIHPTYAIGPVNFSHDSTKVIVPKSLLSETDCTEWLNRKPPGSVLYVSFGSLVHSDKQVIQEIARGLQLSLANFIWVIRPHLVADEANVLPIGFEDEVKDRGLVVPWCNQNAVLSHPAVGGFLTHCGWNSTLESVWVGVPMICYPVLYDQLTNRKLVVDDWKVGINLCEEGGMINGEAVAVKIKTLMSAETSGHIRVEMNKLQKLMHNALAEDGSSETNFNQFVEDLTKELVAIADKECINKKNQI